MNCLRGGSSTKSEVTKSAEAQTVFHAMMDKERHVSHSSGLPKTILRGTVKGGRGQGRQKERRKDLDNISEWVGLEFTKSQTAV